ncbi:MAG TPA: hypothetical protein VEP29_02585 [Desulfatiglandales bacterium]|nr:hypothetical protein [Desulfatiglandales bacterium]
MPTIDKHMQKSSARTGKDYREIHEWIDDPERKIERHDLSRVLEVGNLFQEKYGNEGANEYVRHLQDDLKARFAHLLEDVEKLMNDHLNYFRC